MSNTKEELMTIRYEIDGNEVKLSPAIVKNYISGGADLTDQEYKFFVEICKVRKLNPFLKEVYAIKYGNQQAQIVVGKDAILKRAVKHPKFNGREQGIIIVDKDGKIVERNGSFRLGTETLVGGWARVYRKDWEHATYISVSLADVAQKKSDGTLNSQWLNHAETMVEKVALVRALRETFVEDLGGMIDEDEVWKDVEPRTPVTPTKKQADVIDVQPETLADIMNLDDIDGL